MPDGKISRFEDFAGRQRREKERDNKPVLPGDPSGQLLEFPVRAPFGGRLGSLSLLGSGDSSESYRRFREAFGCGDSDNSGFATRFTGENDRDPDPISAARKKLEEELILADLKKNIGKKQAARIAAAQAAFMIALEHDPRDNLEDLVGIDPRIGELRRRAGEVVLSASPNATTAAQYAQNWVIFHKAAKAQEAARAVRDAKAAKSPLSLVPTQE